MFRSLGLGASCCVTAWCSHDGAAMTLSPDAHAVIDGRHADPFHYLGPHVEDDEPVVRVFLPDAAQVRSSTTPATRASCRASMTPGCSPVQ